MTQSSGTLYGGAAKAIMTGCALFSLNCFQDPLPAVAPQWDVAVTVPVSRRTFTLQDMVEKDSSLLKASGDNQIVYSTSMQAPSTTVGDQITIKSLNASSTVQLGNFGVSVSAIDVPIGVPAFAGGYTGIVPPGTFTVPDIPGVVGTGVDLTLVSGSARLTLRNVSPVALSVTTPVTATNSQGASITFAFPDPIPAGASYTAVADLSGKVIASDEKLTGISLSTPGSGVQSVTMPGAPLLATLTPVDMVASGATVPTLPAQRLMNNAATRFALSDSTKIQNAAIKSGAIALTFVSSLPTDIRLKFRIAEIHRASGAQFDDSVTIASGTTQKYTLNLAGTYLASPVAGAFIDSLTFTTGVVLPADVNHPVTIDAADHLTIAMSTSLPIVADSASVVLRPTRVLVHSGVKCNFGNLMSKFTGSLVIPSADLDFRVNSSIGFPADLSLRLVGLTADGDSAVLLLPASQRRIVPGNSVLKFTSAEVGQFLSTFGTHLPDSLALDGCVLINPPDAYTPTPAGVATIGRQSSVTGSVDFKIPLCLSIADGVYSDTLSFGDADGDGKNDNSFDRRKLSEVNEGTMYAEFENGLPIGLGLQLILLDSAGVPILTLPGPGASLSVAPGAVDALGLSSTSTPSTMSLNLTGPQVDQFRKAARIATRLSLATSGSGPVKLRTSDSVTVRVWSSLSARVNK
jgi:hypothetical protein